MAGAYKVSAKVTDDEGTSKTVTRFAGSQSDASARKRDIMAEHGVKRDAVRVDPIDIPTSKSGLIPWLNENIV